ncbi:hypothetical protein [Halomicrobium salinisoli]|uniref:hypothetical protein n=1 Tax=Halomicrobium salinisoli TaxID=2878391 RepID=UPI001CEFE0BD|nr:hypothetical protein [Halomicrobium salinisoli]
MSESGQGGAGRREVAYRLFASEFDDADFSYSESDEERAPNYVVTPTGARVNRLFLVGVLTEVETVSEDYLRARVVDPTGPFVVYAGQYQPDALAFLERADPPLFVAVTGKARTYQPDDADTVYTSVRPESISEVDADTRDRWVVGTAEQTVDRVARAAEAKLSELEGDDLRAALEESGVDEGLAAGLPIALEHYGTTGDYLAAMRDLAVDAARVVAGERDEVESATVAPDQGGDDPLSDLAEGTLDTSVVAGDEETEDVEAAVAESAPEAGAEVDQRAGTADPQRTDDPDGPSISSEGERSEPSETASGSERSERHASTTDAEPEAEDDSTADAETTAGASDESASADADSQPEETAATSDESAPAETGAAGIEESGEDVIAEAEEPAGEMPSTASGSGPTTEDASAADDADGSEIGSGDESAATADDGDIGDFEPEFDLDEEEREELESEFGTEFQSGTEVEEPGEADIDAPDPEELDEETGVPAAAGGADEAEHQATPEAEPETSGADEAAVEETTEETEADADESADADEPAETEPDEDVDLEDAVMDAMGDLDEGDGADREEVVAAVVDRTGADPGEVEDAVQDALMGGRCYEPEDGLLKPI